MVMHPITGVGQDQCESYVETVNEHGKTVLRRCANRAVRYVADLTHLRRGKVGACECDEHGGAARAIERIQTDWLYVAPDEAGDVESVMAAGTECLRTPDAYIVLRQEHGRWLAWLGLGTMLRQVQMRDTPRLHKGRPYMRGNKPRGLMAADTREEAMAKARARWRLELEQHVDAIIEMRGGTLDWGVPVEPAHEPVVVDAPERKCGWDIATSLPRMARQGIGCISGLRPSGESL